MRFHHRFLASAVAAFLATAPALADVKTGVDAWQSGNFTGAVKEWRPLADKGDADAQFNMGQAYKLGRGVPSDLKIAQTWYEKAAQQGHDQAQANLGLILFQNGQRAAALPWLRKAADRGDARAQYIMGTAMFNGDLVGKDWPRAYALMTRSAAQGLPQAASSLAEMDKHIPIADRQKGVAMAREPILTASAAVPAKTPRTAGTAPPPSPSAAVAKSVAPPAAPKAAASAGGWRVQLGAYGSRSAAQGQWAAIAKKVPALSGLTPSYEAAGNFTRLRVGPAASRAAADKLCAAAKSAGQACFPVAP